MVRFILSIIIFYLADDIYSQQQVRLNGFDETLYSITPGISSTDSYTPLTNFFQSKEIIGAGEATHGTHEFFQTKVELFQFLVTKCHFRVFGIEASYGAQMYVNDYVTKGIGSIEETMQFLDWPWGTDEVRDLVEWMRIYNSDKAENDQISFYGFDCQNLSHGIKYLDRLFLNSSSDFTRVFKKITPLLTANSEYDLFQMILNDKETFKDSLYRTNESLEDWIKLNEVVILKSYGIKDFARIKLCIENFDQALDFLFGGNTTLNFRDSCMASNVLKIYEIEQNKMFIWAHNGHIGKEFSKISIMGTHLKAIMKEKYYAIGFAFDHGNFMAWKGPNTLAGAFIRFLINRKNIYQGLMECTAATNEKNTLTNELKKSNLPSFFIDLNSTTNQLFSTTQKYYDIGASYLNNKRASRNIIAKDEFDGLIFFNCTSATKILKN